MAIIVFRPSRLSTIVLLLLLAASILGQLLHQNPIQIQSTPERANLQSRQEPNVKAISNPLDPGDVDQGSFCLVNADLSDRFIISPTCCTDDKRAEVEDALLYLDTFVRQGVRKSVELKKVWTDGFNLPFPNGDREGGNRALEKHCPVWPKIFGTVADSSHMRAWADDWNKMRRLLNNTDDETDTERVLITCHKTMGRTDIPTEPNLCGSARIAFQVPGTGVARTPSVASPDPRFDVYKTLNINLVNLCPLFFKSPPETLGRATEKFYADMKSHIQYPKQVPAPELPKLDGSPMRAEIILHEMFHLDWASNYGHEDDYTTIQKVKKRAKADGFATSRNKPDPNAYFAMWSYFSSLKNTANCDMY